MEIEVLTTKRRLTKSMISQMLWPSLVELKISGVLGYVYNIEGRGKIYILKISDGIYRKIPHGWRSHGHKEVVTAHRTIEFPTSVERDEFLSCMNTLHFEAKQIYI